jgi:hypothetical protein
MMRRSKLLFLITVVLLPSLAFCFISSTTPRPPPESAESSVHRRTRTFSRRGSARSNSPPLAALDRSTGHDDTEGDWKKEVVTKEMFLRDILEPRETDTAVPDEDDDVSVRTKKKGKKRFSEYKVLDNRDILPFRVTLDTPDPYTHPEVKKKNAARTRKHGNSVEEHLIKSTLYNINKNRKSGDGGSGQKVDPAVEELGTLLGEYQLGKDTTTGDILLIGNSEYKVIRHRCQYKYAGAQRFVMVRKILEVKEVGRLLSESALKRQWNNQSDASSSSTTTTGQLLGDDEYEP